MPEKIGQLGVGATCYKVGGKVRTINSISRASDLSGQRRVGRPRYTAGREAWIAEWGSKAATEESGASDAPPRGSKVIITYKYVGIETYFGGREFCNEHGMARTRENKGKLDPRGGTSETMDELVSRENIRQAINCGHGQAEVPTRLAAESLHGEDVRGCKQAGPSLLGRREDERSRMARDHCVQLRFPPPVAYGITDVEDEDTQKAQWLEELTQKVRSQKMSGSDMSESAGYNECCGVGCCRYELGKRRWNGIRMVHAAICMIGIHYFEVDPAYKSAWRVPARHPYRGKAQVNLCMKSIRWLRADVGSPARYSAGCCLINILCIATKFAKVLILSTVLMISIMCMLNQMQVDEHVNTGIKGDLHRKRFDREGVFDSEYPFITQSYMLCIDRTCILVCISTYTCTDFHSQLNANAHSCIDTNCMHSIIIWLKCDSA